MNKTSTSSALGFGCSQHKENCDIFPEDLVLHRLKAYSSNNYGGVLSYINRVESRYVIELQATCDDQNCGEKKVLMLRICLLNVILQ